MTPATRQRGHALVQRRSVHRRGHRERAGCRRTVHSNSSSWTTAQPTERSLWPSNTLTRFISCPSPTWGTREPCATGVSSRLTGNSLLSSMPTTPGCPTSSQIQADLLLTRPDLGLVHSNLEVIDEQGRYLREIFLGVPGSRGLTDDHAESSFTQLMKGESGVWTSSVLLRRECIDRVGMFDESLAVAEDWDLWIRIARTFKIGYIERALARHRCHPTNTGRHWIPETTPPEIQLWSKVLRSYPEIEPEWGDLIRAKCALHYVLNAIRCVQRGYYRRAAALIAQLARYDFGKTGFRRFGALAVRFFHRHCLQKGRELLGRTNR